MTYHVPVCLNCRTHEVQAPFFYGKEGDGFCSKQCEQEAFEFELVVEAQAYVYGDERRLEY